MMEKLTMKKKNMALLSKKKKNHWRYTLKDQVVELYVGEASCARQPREPYLILIIFKLNTVYI